VRQLRLNAQQPLEHARAVNHLIAIKLFTQRQTPGSGFQGKIVSSLIRILLSASWRTFHILLRQQCPAQQQGAGQSATFSS
jgi:hypothetical protein